MNPDLVRNYLTGLQDRLCATLEEVDGKAKFITDEWQRAEGGGGRTRVIAGGAVIEKGGVAFSDVRGHALPPSATIARSNSSPSIVGRAASPRLVTREPSRTEPSGRHRRQKRHRQMMI
mgnify:CR=1 FL=1